jgi:ParB family chromosome partitioning protein
MEAFSDDNLDLLRDYALAQLEAARALHPRVTIGCAAVSPDHDFGIDLVFFANPAAPEVEDPAPEATADAIAEGAPSPAEPPPAPVASAHIEIGASTNALHERYTDVATRGLIRAVSEDPNAALSLIIARLFSTIALGGDPQSASTIQATTYTKPGADPIEALDGVVRAKVAEQVKAFNDSGLTVLAWIDALPRSEKMELMAALTALTLNARETGPNHTRPRARAEAAELAEMTGYDIVNYWTPNVEFFAAHRRADLVGILDRMGAGDAPASDLKQGDLAVHVAEQAAERVWAPDALSWRQAAAPANALSPDIDDLAA